MHRYPRLVAEMKKTLIGVALAIAAVFALPTAANAVVDFSNGDSAQGVAGGTLEIGLLGTGLTDGTFADVAWDGPEAPTITPIANGTVAGGARIADGGTAYFSFTASVPGDYTLTVGAASVTVTAAAPVPADQLQNTGTPDVMPYVWLGIGLVGVGAALVVTFVAVRRQRVHSSAE